MGVTKMNLAATLSESTFDAEAAYKGAETYPCGTWSAFVVEDEVDGACNQPRQRCIFDTRSKDQRGTKFA